MQHAVCSFSSLLLRSAHASPAHACTSPPTSPAHALYSPTCCRDRAKERRDGLNIDFADAEQELAARGLGPTALKSLTIGASFVWLGAGLPEYAGLELARPSNSRGGGGSYQQQQRCMHAPVSASSNVC